MSSLTVFIKRNRAAGSNLVLKMDEPCLPKSVFKGVSHFQLMIFAKYKNFVVPHIRQF